MTSSFRSLAGRGKFSGLPSVSFSLSLRDHFSESAVPTSTIQQRVRKSRDDDKYGSLYRRPAAPEPAPPPPPKPKPAPKSSAKGDHLSVTSIHPYPALRRDMTSVVLTCLVLINALALAVDSCESPAREEGAKKERGCARIPGRRRSREECDICSVEIWEAAECGVLYRSLTARDAPLAGGTARKGTARVVEGLADGQRVFAINQV